MVWPLGIPQMVLALTRTPKYNWQLLRRASTFRGSSYCPLFSQRNVAVCTPVTLLSQGEVQGKRSRSANIIYVRQTAALYLKQPFSSCPLRRMMALLLENTLLCSPINATPFSLSSQKAQRLPELARAWINVDTTNLTSSIFDLVL